MAYTGSLIHQALAKKLVEKMMVEGAKDGGQCSVKHGTTTATTKNHELSLLKSSISVENWLGKENVKLFDVACPGNSNELCHHCQFHKRMKSPARHRWQF